MTCLPTGTHEKGQKNEMFCFPKMLQMNTTVITVFFHNVFNMLWMWKEGQLIWFQWSSAGFLLQNEQSETNAGSIQKNGYRVAFLSWRHSSLVFRIMSALTSPWCICKIFSALPAYLNIFKAPHLIIQVWSLTSSFPEYFLVI